MAEADNTDAARRLEREFILAFGPPEHPLDAAGGVAAAMSPRHRRYMERSARRRMLLRGENYRMRRGDNNSRNRAEEAEMLFEQEWWTLQMEQDRLRRQQEREEQRRREEEERERWNRRLRRGISSFQQEHSVFGHGVFQAPPSVVKDAPGIENVIASPSFDAKRLFLKRVTACIGWAVHGIVFEFADNTRVGCILDGFAEVRLDLTDENIQKRLGVEWQNVDYGDYIVGIHGNRLHNTSLLWMCHTVVLEFRSGKTIRFEARQEPWRGQPFAYQVPQPSLVYRITFRHEQRQDMRGLITTIHLPLTVANMEHLPLQNKRALERLLGVLREIDTSRESNGRKALSDDLWWNILGWIRAWEMPVPLNIQESGLCNRFESLCAS